MINKLVAPGQLNDFLAGRISSPFTLVMKENDVARDKPTDSIGRRIDLYYIANGKLSTVSSEGFVKATTGSRTKKQARRRAVLHRPRIEGPRPNGRR